ncbi:MAG TPA: hypothetical protein VIV15_07700 [Anaerolineales bacterium]
MTNLLRSIRPLYLLLAALTYTLGATLAGYLGNPGTPAGFWLGLAAVLLAQAVMTLLAEVFRPVTDPIIPEETIQQRRSLHDQMLYSALTGLAAFCVIVFLLFNGGHLSGQAALFFLVELLTGLLYAVPPARLVNRGFGEPLLAIHLAYVIPSLGFLIPAGEYHRLLSMLVFPLTLLALACFLVLNFPTFARDRKYNRGTMLVQMGWQRALPLHNILIGVAYLVLLGAPLFGVSLAVIWPAFLTLPFAILQVFLLRNIAQGGRPIWTLLSATATAVFGLTAYFLTLTFWLR